MTPSVSPEADWELTREAVFYAREGGAELGVAFIAEFERALTLLCDHPKLGAPCRNRRRRLPLRNPGAHNRCAALAVTRPDAGRWAAVAESIAKESGQ